jgi:hypothetical protein
MIQGVVGVPDNPALKTTASRATVRAMPNTIHRALACILLAHPLTKISPLLTELSPYWTFTFSPTQNYKVGYIVAASTQ